MGSSRFWLKAADEESKSIPHEFPRSHWLKATGQCVLERYLSATMVINGDTIRIQIKISGPLQRPIPTKWPSWKTHLTYFRHIVINDELMETQATLTNCMKINQHKRSKNYFNEFHVTCCKTLGPMTARRKKKNIFFFQKQQKKQKQKQNKQTIYPWRVY